MIDENIYIYIYIYIICSSAGVVINILYKCESKNKFVHLSIMFSFDIYIYR